ncbi:MAG: mandelate racemase/muconate lactonizing enzyme family protein [Conexivisphaerales archaeon]
MHSHGPVSAFSNGIVELQTDEGISGYGEIDLLNGVTTETLTTIKEIVERYLAPVVVGKDPLDIERICDDMDQRLKGNYVAKAGIDNALWDLAGKYLKQPAFKLMGGRYSDKIEVDYTLSMDVPEKMAMMARKMVGYGYKTLVVKVGINSELDVARLRAVREEVGDGIKLRLDVNEAYTVDKAISMIRRFERYDPELVEQPLPRWDVKGMARVARAVDTPISADEGNSSPQMAFTLVEQGAVDVLNIKPPYHGGLWNAKKVAAIAAATGTPVIVGGMTHFEVGRQANRHFAISSRITFSGYAHEGPGPASQSLTDNVTKRVVTYDDVKRWGGYVHVSDEAGLGFEIDESKLRRYAIV